MVGKEKKRSRLIEMEVLSKMNFCIQRDRKVIAFTQDIAKGWKRETKNSSEKL